MGNRLVVVLHTDQTDEWQSDETLGQKIAAGMNYVQDTSWGSPADLGYGRVVELAHTDTQTLALIESYRFSPVAHGFWYRGETKERKELTLLKQWAERLGYRLSKIPTKDKNEDFGPHQET